MIDFVLRRDRLTSPPPRFALPSPRVRPPPAKRDGGSAASSGEATVKGANSQERRRASCPPPLPPSVPLPGHGPGCHGHAPPRSGRGVSWARSPDPPARRRPRAVSSARALPAPSPLHRGLVLLNYGGPSLPRCRRLRRHSSPGRSAARPPRAVRRSTSVCVGERRIGERENTHSWSNVIMHCKILMNIRKIN